MSDKKQGKMITLLLVVLAVLAIMTGCAQQTVQTVPTDATSTSLEAGKEELKSPVFAPLSEIDSGGDIVKQAVRFGESSVEAPTSLGDWAEVGFPGVDDLYHTVFMRIKAVDDDAAYVKESLERNNEVAGDLSQVNFDDFDLPDDVTTRIVDYEVYIPSDFPVGEDGILDLFVSFAAKSTEFNGIPNESETIIYADMGEVERLRTEKPAQANFVPGKAYKLRGYYFMTKNYEDYLFETYAYPDGFKVGESDMEEAETVYFSTH